MTAKEPCPRPAKIRKQQGCVLLSPGDLQTSLPLLAIRQPTLPSWSGFDL
jgi:hypothetical protein